MSEPKSGARPDITIDNSHVSEHGTSGTERAHDISQNISTDRGSGAESSAVAYTDVDASGDVSESGFDTPTSEK